MNVIQGSKIWTIYIINVWVPYVQPKIKSLHNISLELKYMYFSFRVTEHSSNILFLTFVIIQEEFKQNYYLKKKYKFNHSLLKLT